jgi:hypothetical protein
VVLAFDFAEAAINFIVVKIRAKSASIAVFNWYCLGQTNENINNIGHCLHLQPLGNGNIENR